MISSQKKNDPLHLCLLKENCVISWLVRLFNKVKNIKIFVLAFTLSQCYKNHRIEPANHLFGFLDGEA